MEREKLKDIDSLAILASMKTLTITVCCHCLLRVKKLADGSRILTWYCDGYHPEYFAWLEEQKQGESEEGRIDEFEGYSVLPYFGRQRVRI